ncbi:MAG: flagellar hook-length control protein FliK [Pseudomonadota bacterium]
MRIPGANLFIPLPASMPKEQLLQSLKPGQILRGTALSENQHGSVRLQIGVTRLIAQTQVSVRPGQPLTLQVDKTGDFPELRLLTHPTLQQQQAKALKSILPRQQPIPQLLDKLVHLTDSAAKTVLPTEVKQAFQSLLARLPSTENPDFRVQIKEALLNSGLFTEARLMSDSTSSGDLKLNLLRLIRLLQTAITQQPEVKQSGAQSAEPADPKGPAIKLLNALLKQLDATLARIQTNQLASLPQDEPGRQIWQFELPILHGDSIDPFQVLIKRDQSQASDAEANIWSLTLQMNLQLLGPMRIQLTLQAAAISTVIWAEWENTTNLVKAHLAVLHKAYETAGLEVKKLETYQGRIEALDAMPSDLSLLSEKA